MFDRPRSGERAVLVHIVFAASLGSAQDRSKNQSTLCQLPEPLYSQSIERTLSEFRELARSAGALEVAVVTGRRSAPDPRYFLGSGKAEEIRAEMLAQNAELVIINHDLSPSQERNLERLLQCRVLDRSGLILDIFAQRARSFEGKLQVELAQLQHLSTRLVRGWTHLERQKGGIGLRGPGETQLESDRRLIAGRIKQINKRLQKVDRQRNQGRQARRKATVSTVSLVGYTNTGKSTLFNRLTEAQVYAANQLFATLDPTLRRLKLPQAQSIVLADTVGFISDLPHELVAAFRSTLQETVEANLLLHIIDASDPERDFYSAQVDSVLAEIGAAGVPVIKVFNKIDHLPMEPRLERDCSGRIQSVWLSALQNQGLDLLRGALAEQLCSETVHTWLRLPPSQGKLRARLFTLQAVVGEQLSSNGEWLIEVHTSRKNLNQLARQEGFRNEWLAGETYPS